MIISTGQPYSHHLYDSICTFFIPFAFFSLKTSKGLHSIQNISLPSYNDSQQVCTSCAQQLSFAPSAFQQDLRFDHMDEIIENSSSNNVEKIISADELTISPPFYRTNSQKPADELIQQFQRTFSDIILKQGQDDSADQALNELVNPSRYFLPFPL